MSSDISKEVGAHPKVEWPGHNLKRAREAKRLGVKEVALDLHLSERFVTALEENDVQVLPPPTFVKGYLRSYARLLDLQPEKVVAEYEECTAELPPISSTRTASARHVDSRDLPVRIMTYLVGIGLLVLLVSWWLTHRDTWMSDSETLYPVIAEGVPGTVIREESAPEPESIPPEEGDIPDAALTSESVPTGSQAVEEGVTPPADEAIAEESPVAEEVVPLPGESQAGEVAVLPGEQVATVTTPSEDQAVAASPEGQAVASPPPLTPEIPQSSLRITFSDDCWIEVNDAAGRSVYYDLAQAGDERTVYGEAPFRVFLGYADGVVIEYNGVLFDHAPFARGKVARFRVGRAEDNTPR